MSNAETKRPLEDILGLSPNNEPMQRRSLEDILGIAKAEDSMDQQPTPQSVQPQSNTPEITAPEHSYQETIPTSSILGGEQKREGVFAESLDKQMQKEHLSKMSTDPAYRDDYFRGLGYQDAEDYRKRTADKLEETLKNIGNTLPESLVTPRSGIEALRTGADDQFSRLTPQDKATLRNFDKVRNAIKTLRSNNFWSGLGEGFDLKDIATLGFAQVGDNVAAINALNKAHRGEQLNDMEKALVDAWKLGQQVEGEIALLGGRSLASNIGRGVGESLPFVTEMIATGGAAAAATKGISKAIAKNALKTSAKELLEEGSQQVAKKLSKDRIVSGLQKGSLKLAESAVGSAVRVPLSGGVYKNYTTKRLDQFIADDGEIKKYVTPAWKDALKAGFETFAEYQSEDVGNWIGAPINSLGSRFAHSGFGKMLRLDQIADYKGNAGIEWLRDQAKITNLVGETLGEAYGDALVNTFEQDKDGWRQMLTKEYWWQLAGVSSILPLATSIPNVLSSGQIDYSRRVAELKKIKTNALAAIKNSDLRTQLTKAAAAPTIAQRSEILKGINWKDTAISKADGFNAVKYINATTAFDISEGEASETERLARFFPIATYLEERAYMGKDGKEATNDIIEIADNKGNAYTVQSGDIDSEDPNTILKAKDSQGRLWDIPLGDVVSTSRGSIRDKVAEAYAMMFGTQAKQQSLDKLQSKINEAVAVGVSNEDIHNIIEENGLTQFKNGDLITLVDGRQGEIIDFDKGRYLISTIDQNGAVLLDSYGINDIVQPEMTAADVAMQKAEPTTEVVATTQPAVEPIPTPEQQAIEGVIVEAERVIDEQIDNATNVADGNVYNCILEDDSEVVIRNGNIVLTENGEIDAAKSDSTIVVEYPDGRKQTISPQRIAYIASAENAQQAKENAHEQLRNVVTEQERQSNINMAINNGDPVVTTDGRQGVVSATKDGTLALTDTEGNTSAITFEDIADVAAPTEEVAETVPEAVEPEVEFNTLSDDPSLQSEKQKLISKLKSWLTPENISWAEGKDLNESIEKFGNDVEPIAILPSVLKNYFPQLTSLYLYSGKGYLIDHAANHHPELSIDDYENIQTVLDEYDDIKDLSNDKVKKIAFIKMLDKGYAVVTELSESNGRIFLHKTFFYKDSQGKRVPYRNKESLLKKAPVDGSTTISPAMDAAGRHREISALDATSENKDTTSDSEIQIPRLKNGEVDYNSMSPEMFTEYFLEQFGEQALVKLARNNIKSVDKTIGDVSRKIENLVDPNKMASLSTQLENAILSRQRYERVLDLIGASEIEESDTERSARLKQEATPRIAQLFPDGLPNAESVVLADIATGKKIRWFDLERNGSVVSRGLGAELGLSNSTKERNRRFGLLSNNAPTPEQYAEELPERLNAMGIRYDESALRDIVLDVYSSVDTRSNAWEVLEQMAQDTASDIPMDYEDAQMKANYEREQRELNGTPEVAPVSEEPSSAAIGETELSTEETVPFSLKEGAGLVTDNFTATLPEQEVSFIDALARALGVKVEFVDVIPGADANAAIFGDKVLIRKKDRTKAVKFLVGHEFTHRMQDLSPEAYADYKGAVKAYMGKRFDTVAARLVRAYEAQKLPYTMDLIEDEVVADFAGEIALKTTVFDNFLKANAENKTLWQVILDVLRSIRDSFAGLFSSKQEQALLHAINKLEDLLEVSSAKVSATNQIKSATDNFDTFDVNRYNIKSAPVFYSNAENAVRNIKQEKATPEQWLKMIEKNGGLKAGEDKWLELSDWLKTSDKKSLTKQEVLGYIEDNKIQIEEVSYADIADISRDDIYASDEFLALIDSLTEYETDENGNETPYISRAKYDELRSESADFVDGFSLDYWGEELTVDSPAAAAEYLGLSKADKVIDSTRLRYTTDGLTNKREIALTVRYIEPWGASDEIHFGDAGEGRAVAWMRFGETTDTVGNRVLVIDEIQSKRHQEGRERGYGTDVTKQEVDKAREELDVVFRMIESYEAQMTEKYGNAYWTGQATEDEVNHWELLRSEFGRLQDTYEDLADKFRVSIPAAPFEKNWAELAMKRMLRYAAENGYDKVAWTTGEQQAERYNLGAVMTGLKAYKTYSGEYYVMPYNNGAIGEFTKEYTEKELADTFGKELATNIITNAENATEENPYEIEGENLRFGGSGMKTFYDTMLVNFMNKYGKKWGVKVGEVTMPELKENNTMHSVDVTDAMRDSVMQGQLMFSIKDVPSLVGIHNLSLEKLRKVIKMGGSLANPSVAVVDIDKSDHSDYGDYSLILPKHLVDSRLGRNAGTWAGDAWTPTYPSVVKKIKKSADVTRFYKDINKMPSPISSKVALDFDSYLENRSANALYYWYLFDKGDAPELRTVPSKYSAEIKDALNGITNGSFSLYGLTPEQRAKCVDVYIAQNYGGDRAAYERDLQSQLERIQKFLDHKNGLVARKAKEDLESIKEYGFDYDKIAVFVRDVEYDVRHSGQVDVDATIRAAQEQVQQSNLEGDFNSWKDSLDSKYGIEEFIFDGYTPSGNQKWLPHTTANASKWVKKQGRVAATGTFPSFGMFIATVIPRMTSLESIRKRKKQLGNSQEVYDAFREKWENTYYNLGKKLQPEANTFDDYGWWRLMEAATKSDPQKYIKDQYNIDFSDEDMATLNTLLDAIKKEYPAKYFETKFERPVKLSEFAAAVVPDTIPVPVEEYLRLSDLAIYKYDKSVEGSQREATLKAVDSPNIRFSIKSTPAAAVMDQQRAEFEKLTEEYDSLLQNRDNNPNFESALNEWRDRKVKILQNYLYAFAEDLGIDQYVVIDIFNTRGVREEYSPIVDLWMPGISEEERQKALDLLSNPETVGVFAPQNGVLIDVSHSDDSELKVYEEALVHEFSHYDDYHMKSDEDLFNLYVENEELIKKFEDLSPYVESGASEEVLATELLSAAMGRIYRRGAFTALVNGSITSEEAVGALKYSKPLMREFLIEKLNRYKDYAEQAAERRKTTEASYVPSNKSGWNDERGVYISDGAGGRSTVEDEEFVEVDIQDLIDRGEEFEILVPENARFSIKSEGERAAIETSAIEATDRARTMWAELEAMQLPREEIAKRVKEATGVERTKNGWKYIFPKRVYNEAQPIATKTKSSLQLARERVSELYHELRNSRKSINEIIETISKEIRGSISTELVEVMGKRDFDNIVRIIEEAVAKGDIEQALRQLEAQLLKLEESSLRNAYNKMMNLKLEGTNPRGVSVSRWVDQTARVSINTYKEALAKGMRADELDKEFHDEWQFGKGEKFREPFAMFTAIELLQHHDDVQRYEAEIAAIDEEIAELRQQNSELFYQGRKASENGNREEAQKYYRGIKINKEIIADQLVERLGIAEKRNASMRMLTNALNETIMYGRSAFAEMRARRELEKAEIVNMGFKDCVNWDKPTPGQDEEISDAKQFGRDVLEFLISPAYSMNSALKYISINAPGGEGALYNHFVKSKRGYIAAQAQFYTEYNKVINEYSEKAKEIFGEDYDKVVSNSDADSTIKVTIINGKRTEDILLTYGEAMYLYMADKMSDGRVKIRKMGISEEDMNALVANIPQQYIQFADWIQGEFLPSLREKYNQTHLECFGIPMSEVDNYVPLKVLKSKTYQEVDGSSRDSATLPSAITGSIIKRTRNTLPIDLHTNALEVVRQHIEDMEHWNAYTFVIQDMNALLSSTEFRRMIDHLHPGMHKKLKDLAQVAVGTYSSEATAIDKGFAALNKVAATSKIAFRINTALKQVLSYPAFYAYAVDAKYWKQLTRNLSPDVWKENFEWAINNCPSFKARWESRSAGNEKLSQATMAQFDKIVKKINNVGMFPNAFVDAMTCANGAKAVYDYKLEYYKERGLENAEAERLALLDAATSLNETQQSSEGLYLSTLQSRRDFFSISLSTFQNSNFAYLRKQLEAIVELRRDRDKEISNRVKYYEEQGMESSKAEELAIKDVKDAKMKAGAELIMFSVMLNMMWTLGGKVWQYLFGDDDDREEIPMEALKAFALSPIRNTVIGSTLESIAGGYGASQALFFTDLHRSIQDIQRAAQNDPKSWDQTAFWITARILVTNGVGVDLTTFANVYQGVAGMIRDGVHVEDIMNILNAPQSQAKLLAGKPKEGESLEEYQKRMAFIYKRTNDPTKKDLARWEREYIAGQQRKLLLENGYSSVDMEKSNKRYNEIRKVMGITRSGNLNEDARYEFKHHDPEEQELIRELLRNTRIINTKQKQLERMVDFNDSYLQLMLDIEDLRQEVIEKYDKSNK